ncbi:asparagine synthase-related protein [Vibrio splendidus]|uniref:asparagine synthase-related protein n=1 Tax=Vibrio splendidus TaxID=29497 RepID=UPI0024682A60|nr:asparagine synthase-related protein [Vibrio splendidus]MDH5905128.1 asparagine synthase-related protein [Vibrio splendidus]
MKVKKYIKGLLEDCQNLDDLSVGTVSIVFELDSIVINTTSLQDRLFIAVEDDVLFISDKLRFISDSMQGNLNVSNESLQFYRKFGFILPPFTQYEDIYLLTPYRAFTVKSNKITFENEHPEFEPTINLPDVLSTYFCHTKDKCDILVSGGIDSSALLGFLSEKKSIHQAYMCNMSSFSEESVKAQSMCNKAKVEFNLIDLDIDMTQHATRFIKETGELISDPVSIVMMNMLEIIGGSSVSFTRLVDGQGADSLLGGLPLNKVLAVRKRLGVFRGGFSFLRHIKVKENRVGFFNRKIYRLTKGIKAIFQPDFSMSIISAITEDDKIKLESDLNLKNRLQEIYEHFNSWEKTLKFFYLFDVLPAREMQKYLYSKENEIDIVAPFLHEDVINKLFNMTDDQLIRDGLFKYPITIMAKNYWPGYFKDSSTSPFQVDYTLKNCSIKDISVSSFSD